MKKEATTILLLAIALLCTGLSYRAPHDDLKEIKPKVFDYQSETYREILKRIEKIGSDNGLEINFIFDDSVVPENESPESLVLRGLDLHRILRFLTAELDVALDVEKRGEVTFVYLHHPVGIKEIRMTSKLPYFYDNNEYLFSGSFELGDFLGRKEILESMTVRYNWDRDVMQVGAHLNFMIARGATRTEIDNLEKQVGFAVLLVTTKGDFVFYANENEAEFLNIRHASESAEFMTAMRYRIAMLLPEDYRTRMIDLFDYERYLKKNENQSH